MEFKKSILEQIGNTPLVRINKINKGLKPQIFAKLESANPGGSVKDRIGYNMILAAEADGSLKPGGTIIEATSGNTGIGIALTAAVKGYNTIFVVTDKVSDEKINYLKAFGGEVIVVSNAVEADHPEYYVTVAKKLNKETPNSIFAYQYSNPSNPEMHYKTTGPELWRQTEGKITHFVSSIGTGGTISGTGRYLKEKNPDIKVIAADPFGSIMKHYKESGEMTKGLPYLVEGIGQDCLPENVHFQYIDKIINVTDKESFHFARMLTKEEGIFCGGSTGTIVKVALDISKDLAEDDIVVFIVCDTGERYLTKVHNLDWLKQHRMLDAEVRTVKDLSDRKNILGFNQLHYVSDNFKVKEAIQMMSEKGFTQLPVFNELHEAVGSIRESRLMKILFEDNSKLDANISDVMEDCFPIFDSSTEVSEIKEALKNNSAVLVKDLGRISDIITRYDLIEFE